MRLRAKTALALAACHTAILTVRCPQRYFHGARGESETYKRNRQGLYDKYIEIKHIKILSELDSFSMCEGHLFYRLLKGSTGKHCVSPA
ncbi:hypothetical protein TNCV_4474491 [Trichonephila clavipes]|nr:hypothetical protein TNCV_4474491 [Trichonephila clavipes]